MIVHTGNKSKPFRVVSHSGKNLGDCKTLSAAHKRLAAVEYFKAQDKGKK